MIGIQALLKASDQSGLAEGLAMASFLKSVVARTASGCGAAPVSNLVLATKAKPELAEGILLSGVKREAAPDHAVTPKKARHDRESSPNPKDVDMVDVAEAARGEGEIAQAVMPLSDEQEEAHEEVEDDEQDDGQADQGKGEEKQKEEQGNKKDGAGLDVVVANPTEVADKELGATNNDGGMQPSAAAPSST